MSSDRQICEDHYKIHYYQPKWVIVLSYFEKLALIFNCSINFVFYCFASKMFKKQMMTAVALCVLLKLLVFQSEETSKGTVDIVGDYLRNCYERTSWKLMTQMRSPVALCVEAARPVGHKSRAGKLFSLELDCTVLRTK